MASTVVLRADRDTPLGRAIAEIRVWLDHEGLEPVDFRTTVGAAGLGFEISFRSEHEAARFQQRFSPLMADSST